MYVYSGFPTAFFSQCKISLHEPNQKNEATYENIFEERLLLNEKFQQLEHKDKVKWERHDPLKTLHSVSMGGQY